MMGTGARPNLHQIISPELIDNRKAFARAYQQASPFRHLVMESFFQEQYANELRNAFPPFDESLAINENGEVGAKCVHEHLPSLGGAWKRLDRLIQSRAFLDWLGELTGIDDLLYDPHYFGGGTHENRHGQDLDPHVDFNRHPITKWHRRLNLIVYLNDIWCPEWGGAIEFHKDPRLPPEDNEIRVVQPEFNRAVLFETTKWSWHGFDRIDLPQGEDDSRSRKSVALYFYTRSRPKEEQTRPHSTIYVERPLPAHIRPGHVLTEEDHVTIQRMLARRDQHLQRLYGNISDLMHRLEVVERLGFDRILRLRARIGGLLRRLGLRK